MANDLAQYEVPESITFTNRMLEIPSLNEMGIPLAGLSYVTKPEMYSGCNPTGFWIERGDHLLTYYLPSFEHDQKRKFWIFNLDDPIRKREFKIYSPINGLLIDNRTELRSLWQNYTRYQFCEEKLLPVLLIPEDEPPPEYHWSVYNEFADQALARLDLIPYRTHSQNQPERWRDGVLSDSDVSNHHSRCLKTLRNRDSQKFNQPRIREFTTDDQILVKEIQKLRAKNLSLRDKLVHISRQFGESA